MSDLSDIRQGVATALVDAGLDATYTVPDRVVPPCVVVQPGEPYLDETRNARADIYEMVLRVTIVVGAGTNETTMNEMDDAIETVIVALRPQQWSTRVSEPYALVIGTGEYPAVDVTIRNYVEIN